MRPLIGFILSAAFLMLASGIATPSVTQKLAAAGLDGGRLGLVLSTWGMGFAAVAVSGASFAARLGHRRTLLMAAFGLSVSLALMYWAGVPALIALGRAGCGAAVALACLAIEPGLGAAAGHRRGLVFGLYLVVSNVAFGLGPLFSGLGSSALALAAGLALLVATPIALVPGAPPRGPVAERPRLDLRLLARRAPGAAIAALAGGATAGTLLSVAPLQAARLGLDPSSTRIYLMAIVAAGAAFPIPLGLLGDRLDRDRVILATSLFVGAGALASMVVPAALGLACMVVAAGFAFALYPLGLGLAQDRLTEEEMPKASGGILLAYAAGSIAGPVGAGALVDRAGPHALAMWVALAGSLAVLGPVLRAASAGLASLEARRIARVQA